MRQAQLQTSWIDSALSNTPGLQRDRPVPELRQACLAPVWQIRAKVAQLQAQVGSVLLVSIVVLPWDAHLAQQTQRTLPHHA
jgi:hypothetical protein